MPTPDRAIRGRVTARNIAVIGIAGLLAIGAFGTALVAAADGRSSGLAERLWPSHPALLTSISMRAIGASAGAGQGVSDAVRSDMRRIAREAPLAPEPFLVAGALAQTEGRAIRAELLFEAARSRDPRSAAARYFLADRYLRSGRVEAGLDELLVLSRLLPNAIEGLVPALSAFAATPEGVAPLRRFLRAAPEYVPLILGRLAQEPDNADLIASLVGSPAPAGDWQRLLIAGLVDRGDYAGAYRNWQRLAGVAAGQTLFNSSFRSLAAPAPFNWTYAASGALVEPAPGGALQIVYYRREDVILAAQTLLLRHGAYRLAMEVSGDREAEGVRWVLTCLPAKQVRLELPLRRAADGAVAGRAVIPASGCPAQTLELRGTASDGAETLNLSISRLQLTREAGA